MAKGTHEYQEDPRNEDILVYVNGELVPRQEAKVSVFDSGFILGDGIWEGLRLHNGPDIDGRVIGSGVRGPITRHLQELYALMIDEECRAR